MAERAERVAVEPRLFALHGAFIILIEGWRRRRVRSQGRRPAAIHVKPEPSAAAILSRLARLSQ
jgi:hypothetical protein